MPKKNDMYGTFVILPKGVRLVDSESKYDVDLRSFDADYDEQLARDESLTSEQREVERIKRRREVNAAWNVVSAHVKKIK